MNKILEHRNKMGFDKFDSRGFFIKKLHEEVHDLVEGYENNDEINIKEELADIFILAKAFCDYEGRNEEELIKNKIKINEKRFDK